MRDINLMPEDIKLNPPPKPEVAKSSNKLLLSVLILILALIFIAGTLVSPKIYVKLLQTQSAKLQAEIASSKYADVRAVDSQIAEIQGTIDKKKDVIDNINTGMSASDVINYAEEALPEGVSYTDMQYSEKKLVIKGNSKDRTAVAEYIVNLNRLDIFSGFLSNVTYRYGDKDILLQFQIELSKPGKEV